MIRVILLQEFQAGAETFERRYRTVELKTDEQLEALLSSGWVFQGIEYRVADTSRENIGPPCAKCARRYDNWPTGMSAFRCPACHEVTMLSDGKWVVFSQSNSAKRIP